MKVDAVKCKQCGRELPESASTSGAERQPCGACGSTSRMIQASRHAEVTLRSMLDLKARGRPFVEATSVVTFIV